MFVCSNPAFFFCSHLSTNTQFASQLSAVRLTSMLSSDQLNRFVEKMQEYESRVVVFFPQQPPTNTQKNNTDFSESLFRLMEQTCVTEKKKSQKSCAKKKKKKRQKKLWFKKRLPTKTREKKGFYKWEWGAWGNIRVCGGYRCVRPQLTLASVGLSAPSSKQRQSGLGKLASLSSRYTANQLTQQLASISATQFEQSATK